MSTQSTVQPVGQLTAENLAIEAANGVSYAYRRFGKADTETPPLVILQHFRGNLDNWDPVLVDGIAAERGVILLDNAAVGLSSGTVPRTVVEMARDAISFLDALELDEVDLLGYSLTTCQMRGCGSSRTPRTASSSSTRPSSPRSSTTS